MAGRIYLLDAQSKLQAMDETPYDSERLLQELLADHSDLLAGEQINADEPRRWLLVKREMCVPGEGSVRWSLDHLYLDQDAIPTLVELKLSSDPRIRREVIGQMLDYAANAVVYWPVEEIRAAFESRCSKENQSADECVQSVLRDGEDGSEFWLRVKTNLQAGRIRMVFLADSIPAELRRVVEFLNEQMDPAEVLAIEVKQFVGGGMKTFVPRVIGQTEASRIRKSGAAAVQKQWDEAAFFEGMVSSCGLDAVGSARKCLEWALRNKLRIWWGRGKNDGSFFPMYDNQFGHNFLFSVWTYGRVELQFQHMKRPPFSDMQKRRDLARRLSEAVGIDIPEPSLTKRPSFGLDALADSGRLAKFLEVFDWALAEIRRDERSEGK